jgi:hypothetical protein
MGGGSDTTQTTQSNQTQQLPPWINQAAQQNYGLAQNVAERPLQQYQGQMVADVAPQTQQSWNTAAAGGNAGQAQYDASQAGYLGVLGQQPQQVTAGQLSNTNLSPYMNPYTQSVINATLPIMQQQLGQQQIGNQSQAAGAGAYGGSRQAIQQGVTQAQGALGMGQMAAQLNQANYGQAQTAAQQDISGKMQADLANQAAQQNQGNLNLQASSGLSALGNAAQQNQIKNFTEQMTAGQMEQQQSQNVINANMAKFNNAWNYPNTQLSVLQSALGMTPYEQATTGSSTTETQQAANPMGMALGGLQALSGLFSGGATSAASGIGSMFGSDRRLKTDISKVGTHAPTKTPIYAYRYKGDPKSYPKVVGPMAEDVKKFAPGAVRKIPGSGGKMAIHPGVLSAMAPPVAGGPGGPNLSLIQGGGPPSATGALAPPIPPGGGKVLGAARRPRMGVRLAQPRGAMAVG